MVGMYIFSLSDIPALQQDETVIDSSNDYACIILSLRHSGNRTIYIYIYYIIIILYIILYIFLYYIL